MERIVVFVLRGVIWVMWMALELANDLSGDQGKYVAVWIVLVMRWSEQQLVKLHQSKAKNSPSA